MQSHFHEFETGPFQLQRKKYHFIIHTEIKLAMAIKKLKFMAALKLVLLLSL